MDLPTYLSDWFGLDTEELQRTGITAFFGSCGVLITGLVALATWRGTQTAQRQRDRLARTERIADIETALWSEIVGNRDHYAATDLDAHANEIAGRFTADAGYVPFVPRDAGTNVFDAVLPDIHVLPDLVIAPVVSYYRQVKAVDLFIQDLRAEAYAAKPADVRLAMYLDYLRMLKKAQRQAIEARDALKQSLDELRPNNNLHQMLARARARGRAPAAVNNPASGPTARPEQSASQASDRSSESPSGAKIMPTEH